MSLQKEYIEKEAAINSICDLCIVENKCVGADRVRCSVYRGIHHCPPADVRPVVRGEWIDCGEVYEGTNRVFAVYRCPVCGEYFKRKAEPHFCENCGADMRKEN